MTKSFPKSTFRDGMVTALPIALGYFPIAFSFGVAATRAGFSTLEAFMMSLIMYAGAAQFLALVLMTSGAPVLVTAATLVAMHVRHVIYGPTLMKRAAGDAASRHSWAWAFGLTDEVFGAALGALVRGNQRFSEPFMFGLAIGAYAAWLGGTAAGAVAGGGALEAYPAINAGLGFMLPALFLSLLLSILSRKQVPVVAIAGLVTVAATVWVSPTAGILGGMIAGAVAGVLGIGRGGKA